MGLRHSDIDFTIRDELRDPDVVPTYLNHCLSHGVGCFLAGIKSVARANDKMTEVAEAMGVHRVTPYRSFSERGNVSFIGVCKALEVLGMTFTIRTKPRPEPE